MYAVHTVYIRYVSTPPIYVQYLYTSSHLPFPERGLFIPPKRFVLNGATRRPLLDSSIAPFGTEQRRHLWAVFMLSLP